MCLEWYKKDLPRRGTHESSHSDWISCQQTCWGQEGIYKIIEKHTYHVIYLILFLMTIMRHFSFQKPIGAGCMSNDACESGKCIDLQCAEELVRWWWPRPPSQDCMYSLLIHILTFDSKETRWRVLQVWRWLPEWRVLLFQVQNHGSYCQPHCGTHHYIPYCGSHHSIPYCGKETR